MTLVNTPGTIDSDYRGEVQVPLINLGRAPFVVERGMRIAQMLVLPVPTCGLSKLTTSTPPREGRADLGILAS